MKKKKAIKLGIKITLILVNACEWADPDPLEDYWVAIANEWDLNVWWNKEKEVYEAAIYPVVSLHGMQHTDGSRPTVLDLNNKFNIKERSKK